MSKGYTTTEGFYDSPVMLGASRIKLERSDKMPIDGLTEINRPPRQGMLRLGIKKKTQGGKEYPSEVDYFILDPETPDEVEKQRLIDKFHEVFGDKPKAIAISLPASDIDEVFPQNYKRYGRNTSLKCIGDGQKAVCTEKEFAQGLETIGHDDRGLPKVECKGRSCVFATTNEAATTKECKATGTLSVDIWPLGGIGVWQVTTGSFNSIVNINSCIRSIVAKYGRAHALPLILERRPQITTFNGKKTTHYTLHINTDKSIEELVRTAQIAPEQVLIEAYGEQVASLPAPAEIMDSETTTEPEKENKPLVVNCPPIDENTGRLPEKVDTGAPDSPDKLAEYDKATEKILETFGGEVVKEEPLSKETKESGEFLDGCKEDAKKELGVEGGKPVSSRAIDKAKEEANQKILETLRKACPDVPLPFPKFMVFCKQKLEACGKGDMYKDTFHLYSVKTAADLEADTKKQTDMRIYLSGLLMDEGVI